jgi:acyl-coenzyme A synthetase/AMP-(fatty) acid ligase
VVAVSELPTNATGKVMKDALRARVLADLDAT